MVFFRVNLLSREILNYKSFHGLELCLLLLLVLSLAFWLSSFEFYMDSQKYLSFVLSCGEGLGFENI